MTNEIYIRRINERQFKQLKEQYMSFEPGERVLVKKSGIKSITSSNKGLIIIENKCSFVLGCSGGTFGNLRFNFGRTERTIGVFTAEECKKTSLGVKSYIQDKTTTFLEENSVLLDSIYFENNNDYPTLFLEKSLIHCTKLGIPSIFYIFKVLDLDSLLSLSSMIEFLNATVSSNQSTFIILENAVCVESKVVRYLEEILTLFKDRKVVPVFSIPFYPIKSSGENLKKVLVEEVSFIGKLPYLLACDTGYCSRNLTIEDWKIYISGIAIVQETIGSPGVVVYNIPGGHPRGNKGISKFSRKTYRTHTESSKDFSSSTGLFFFEGNGSVLASSENGVKFLLFGPKDCENDTECVPCKNNCWACLDDNYILDKISDTF